MVVCITLLFALLGFTSFGDTSCEAYKTQVINDCNALNDSLQYTRYLVGGIMETSHRFLSYTNENNAVQGALQTIYTDSVSALGRVDTNLQQVNAIKVTAQSLVCTSGEGGSCDCAEVLGEINTKLGYIQTLVNTVATSEQPTIITRLNTIINQLSSLTNSVDSSSNTVDLNKIETELEDIHSGVADISDYMDWVYNFLSDDVTDTLDAFKWFVSWDESGAKSFKDFYDLVGVLSSSITNLPSQFQLWPTPIDEVMFLDSPFSVPETGWNLDVLYPYHRSYSVDLLKSVGIIPWVYWGFRNNSSLLSSLNNYAYYDYVVSGVLTNIVADGLSAVTNTLVDQFSIFANDSPLRGTSEEPDKYYDYLTNYYIKVSVNPSGSASEPYTNWFNRVEMLLAALVFKTDKPISNDFTTANVDSMEGALSGALDNVRGIQDNSQSVITSVDKASRSLFAVMSQWDDKLTMAASLPSHIDFVDLGGSDGGADGGADRSSDSGVDTKIGIDLSSGPLKVFADVSRAITTLCWIFVFIFSGWGVASFMVSKFLTVIKLCYAIFKVALGLG